MFFADGNFSYSRVKINVVLALKYNFLPYAPVTKWYIF